MPLEDHVADLGLVAWVADNGVELGDAMSELAMVDIHARPPRSPPTLLALHICMDTNKSSNMLTDWTTMEGLVFDLTEPTVASSRDACPVKQMVMLFSSTEHFWVGEAGRAIRESPLASMVARWRRRSFKIT